MELFKVGDKVDQSAEAAENSNIVQAARDIIYNGPALPQILETVDFQIKSQFEGLLYKHAPTLIQEEMKKVKISINEFNHRMNERITEQFKSLLLSCSEDDAAEKLTKGVADSNFQYLFRESIEQVVRKKEQAPQETLVELLIDRVNNSTPNSDYLVEEAISILKYVNKNQINFILFIGELLENTVRYGPKKNEYIEYIELIHLSQLKWTCSYLLELNLSEIDLEYLKYKGLILEEKQYTTDPLIYDRISNACFPQELKNKLNQSNEELVKLFLPEIDIIIGKFGLETPYKIDVLSKISQTICTKNRYHFMQSVQKYRGDNKEKMEEWANILIIHLSKN